MHLFQTLIGRLNLYQVLHQLLKEFLIQKNHNCKFERKSTQSLLLKLENMEPPNDSLVAGSCYIITILEEVVSHEVQGNLENKNTWR